MATYKKNMIMRALSFWKTKLDESKKETVESEEDQKKEAAKEQADEEQAEIDAADEGTDDAEDTAGDEGLGFDPDADFDQAMDGDGSDAGEMEDDTGSDTDSETSDDASEDDEDAGDDASEDGGEDAGEDAGEDEEDSAEEGDDEDGGDDGDDVGDDEGNDEEKSEFRLEITAPSKKLLDAIPDLCKKFGSKVSVTVAGIDPEGDDEEGSYVTAIKCQDEETLNAVKEEDAVKEAVGGMDGELNESLQYEPNTVGAVIKLLSKSDPRDFLFIRLAPNMKQCMIYDIDRKVMAEGQSTTYLEIAIGNPND